MLMAALTGVVVLDSVYQLLDGPVVMRSYRDARKRRMAAASDASFATIVELITTVARRNFFYHRRLQAVGAESGTVYPPAMQPSAVAI